MSDKMREGSFPGGFPYLAIGSGPPLVYLQGFSLEHTHPTGFARRIATRVVRPLARGGYTVYLTNRRPGMAKGCTMADLAAEHAAAFTQHFGEPVHVLGHSTGGSIALQLGVDHPNVLRKLVVASAAYRLGPIAREAQWAWTHRLAQGQNASHLLAPGFARNLLLRRLIAAALWLTGLFLKAPKDPSDMLAMVEAEDRFDVRDRLGDITVPTLILYGARDYFSPPELFAETAAAIPKGRLMIYPNEGHSVTISRAFFRDVLAFLAK